jgi:hypothetical protein
VGSLYVPLSVDRGNGTVHLDPRSQGWFELGAAAPAPLPCSVHGGYEQAQTVFLGDRAGRAAWELLRLGQILVAASTTNCQAFDAGLRTLEAAFSRRALAAPLGAAPVALPAALIDAVGEICPFVEAVAALAGMTPPAVVAGDSPRDRRVLAGRGGREDAALVVGADGELLPPGVRPRWLPHRGHAIWAWCEEHGRWHCRLKVPFPSARAETTYYAVAAVAIARICGSCDEYLMRRRVLNRSLASLTEAREAVRPELVQLWYRQWARALVEALQPDIHLAAAALEAAAGMR